MELTVSENTSMTNISDFVQIKDEQVYTTSRIVAEKFGKLHKDVLEAIRTTLNEVESTGRKFPLSEMFIETIYTDSTGRTLPQFLITEKGLTLLAMGFTGSKAMQIKLRFLDEFERMSRILNNPELVIADTGSVEAVTAYAMSMIKVGKQMASLANKLANEQQQNKQLTTEVKVKDQLLAEAEPKVQYCDIVLNCKDVVPITYIAKDYGKSAIWLNQVLKDKGIQYKSGDIWLLYQKYAKLGYTKSKTSTFEDKNGNKHTKMHTYWTQKGRLFIYDLLKQDGHLPLIEQE